MSGARDMSGPARDMAGGGDGGMTGPKGSPVIDWILPKESTFGTSTPAEITGRNFAPTVPTSEVYFEQGVNLIPLAGTLVQDERRIQIIVPPTMPVGTYNIVVKNPDGGVGALLGGFTVVAKSGCACSLTPQPPTSALPLTSLVMGLFAARLLRRRRPRQSSEA